MSEQIKYLDDIGLSVYDENIKAYINSSVEASISDVVSGSITVSKAEEANHAVSADTATSAETSEEAKHAISADTATTAGSATTADSATKATQDGSGNVITETYETKTHASAKLAEAKSYADGIKNDLLNGAGEAYDTLKELGDLIDENVDAIEALETIATGKADKVHTHEIGDVTGLQDKLNEISSTIVQSDWDQTDETAIDFIRNKPNEEDALLLVTELGFVEPIADADGNVLTDENGAIYTL